MDNDHAYACCNRTNHFTACNQFSSTSYFSVSDHDFWSRSFIGLDIVFGIRSRQTDKLTVIGNIGCRTFRLGFWCLRWSPRLTPVLFQAKRTKVETGTLRHLLRCSSLSVSGATADQGRRSQSPSFVRSWSKIRQTLMGLVAADCG